MMLYLKMLCHKPDPLVVADGDEEAVHFLTAVAWSAAYNTCRITSRLVHALKFFAMQKQPYSTKLHCLS